VVRKELLDAIDDSIESVGQNTNLSRKLKAWIVDLANGTRDTESTMQHAELVVEAVAITKRKESD
jgi:hypothetical protein